MSEADPYLMEGADCYSQAMQAMQETQEAKNELAIISELGLRPFRSGNQYCFLWGENLIEGVAGYGHSVSGAVKDFNKNYYKDFSKKLMEK